MTKASTDKKLPETYYCDKCGAKVEIRPNFSYTTCRNCGNKVYK